MRKMSKYICCMNEDVAKYLQKYYKFIINSSDIFYFENKLIDIDKTPNLNDLEVFFMDKLTLTF